MTMAGAVTATSNHGSLDLAGSVTDIEATVVADPVATRYGWVIVIGIDGRRVDAFFDSFPAIAPGSKVVVSGMVRPPAPPKHLQPSISVSSMRPVEGPGVLYRLANALRGYLLGQIRAEESRGRGLLAGFLVGDTSEVAGADRESMRLSGLSHFTAVSGSNVALFLGVWVIVLGPLGRAPLRRPALVIAGVVLFAAITRFEPSVIRASAMVVAIMIGRMLGVVADGWTALGAGVSGVLIVQPELGQSLGFQLSVAATVAVLGGSRLIEFSPRWMSSVISVTLSVQTVVAPLLLIRIGEVPALSPLSNLLASPLVVGATVTGGIGGLLGFQPLVAVGSVLATAVLGLAKVGSTWPQMGWLGLGFTYVFVLSLRWFRGSATARLISAAALLVVLLPIGGGSVRPAVVFLDVGQGDAALVMTTTLTVLIDGGPDERALQAALSRYRVRTIDLVIVSHSHADHIEGLAAVFGRIPVGVVWDVIEPSESESGDWLIAAAAQAGVPRVAPPVGHRLVAPGLVLEVLGPGRTYSDANDRSLVVLAEFMQISVLFSGDIEAVAQRDIDSPGHDVIKVPHHGSSSSDLGWLSENAGQVAVVSSGENDYGHPNPEVVATLVEAGSVVLMTDIVGDVVLRPDRGLPAAGD